jgi:hypothetical protein
MEQGGVGRPRGTNAGSGPSTDHLGRDDGATIPGNSGSEQGADGNNFSAWDRLTPEARTELDRFKVLNVELQSALLDALDKATAHFRRRPRSTFWIGRAHPMTARYFGHVCGWTVITPAPNSINIFSPTYPTELLARLRQGGAV